MTRKAERKAPKKAKARKGRFCTFHENFMQHRAHARQRIRNYNSTIFKISVFDHARPIHVFASKNASLKRKKYNKQARVCTTARRGPCASSYYYKYTTTMTTATATTTTTATSTTTTTTATTTTMTTTTTTTTTDRDYYYYYDY